MIDTPLYIQKKQIELFLKKTENERTALGMEMILFGYNVLKGRIARENPMLTKQEITAEIFRQLYGKSFPKEKLEKIAVAITKFQKGKNDNIVSGFYNE